MPGTALLELGAPQCVWEPVCSKRNHAVGGLVLGVSERSRVLNSWKWAVCDLHGRGTGWVSVGFGESHQQRTELGRSGLAQLWYFSLVLTSDGMCLFPTAIISDINRLWYSILHVWDFEGKLGFSCFLDSFLSFVVSWSFSNGYLVTNGGKEERMKEIGYYERIGFKNRHQISTVLMG